TAVGNVGVVLVMSELDADPLIVADGAARLDHGIGHVVALVHKAIAFCCAQYGTEHSLTGRRRAAQLDRILVGLPGTDATLQHDSVRRLFGAVVDYPTNSAWAIAQRRGAFQNLDAINALDAGVVIAAITNKQSGSHRHAILQHQRLVIRSTQAAHADIGDHRAFFFRLDVYAGYAAQRFFGRTRLNPVHFLTAYLRDRAGLTCRFLLGFPGHIDLRQAIIF